MKYWKLTVLGMTAITASLHAQNAGNHNPVFSVPATFLSGEPYIFIGENDGEAYPIRTPVGLEYRRSGSPKTGTTTLEWTSGGGGVSGYDSSSDTDGFKGGNGTASKTGSWTWTGEAEQQSYKDNTIHLQGKTSASSGATATLKSSHSEDPPTNDFEITFTLLKVDVEINQTPAINDDIVRKSTSIDNQYYRQWVKCNLVVDSNFASSVVHFTVSSSGVEFYKITQGGSAPNNDTTPASSISMAASDFTNGIAEFYICGGSSASNLIGDVEINVTPDSAPAPIFSKALTVYEFSNESLETVPGSPYSLLQNPTNPSEYWLTSSLATWLISSTDVDPVGLDYSTPQLSNHELSFSQVGRATVIRILGNPQLITGSQPTGLSSGQYSSVIPDELRWEQVVSGFINDTIADDDPLYIAAGHNTGTNPVGLEQSSQPAVDADTPSASITLPFPTGGFDARDSSTGVVFGKYHYTTIVEISLDYEFKTWAVVYDSPLDVAYPIKQNSWILDVSSNAANNQTSSQVSSSDPNLNPNQGAPYFNNELNDITNGSFSSNAASHTLSVTVP